MPIIKSAKKRVRVAEKAAIRNSKTKRSLKTALKAFHRAVTGGKGAEVVKSHGSAQSNLDKAVKKNVIHKNKAARLKRQLNNHAKAAGVATTGTAKKTAKPASKPAAAKKATAVKKTATAKPTTKKAPAKKPAAKK